MQIAIQSPTEAAAMPRYRLDIEYDGTAFSGWQRQAGQPSVQEAIETAIHAFCGEELRIKGAGRTDSGVHARGQVAHVDLVRDWPEDTVQGALNAHLTRAKVAVAILAASNVDENFDARFSATARHYRYLILNRRAPAALERSRVWHVPRQLDHAAMHEAAQELVGHHDFTTFRSVQCQSKSPVKTLDLLAVERDGDMIAIRASARSFLHNQVRSLVGTLERVGAGAWTPEDVRKALEARDRAACGPVAPADGLYLMSVDYP